MILVTGATGFLGSHLMLQLLAQDAKVALKAMYRSDASIEKVKQFFDFFNKAKDFDRIIWVQADILEIPSLASAFEGVNYVYHCAALISFDPADEEKHRKTNIEGTANVVNFSLDFNVKKLLHVSSTSALGDLLPHEIIVSESTEWNPEVAHSDYAISKYGAEMEVWRAQQEGLKTVIVNPGVIFGIVTNTNDWKTGSAKIFDAIAKSNKFYTKGATGFVGVSDVVLIMITLMNSKITNEKFVLVSENIKYQKLTDLIAKNLNQKPATSYAPKWLTEMAWRFDWIACNIFNQKRKLSKSMAHSLHSKDFYDSSKITEMLGFEFQSIENIIAEMAIPYLKQH